MRKFVVTAVLATSVSLGAIAYAQVKDPPATLATPVEQTELAPQAPITATDARRSASDRDVGEARRYYRAQCNGSGETPGFCECVTAGVAQALMPEEVRIAARTIEERLTAQGDAMAASGTDRTAPGANSADRIAQVESHYADACAQFR